MVKSRNKSPKLTAIDTRDLIILILEAAFMSSDQVNGKTSIQKIAYFSVSSLGIDNDFKPHYFGPYSHQITSSVEELISLGFVEEKVAFTQNKRKMYSYSLTQDGKLYSSKLSKTLKNIFQEIKKIVDSINQIQQDQINRLSCAAKIHYLNNITKSNKIDIDTAIKNARKLGWNMNEQQIINGKNALENISF